jgi:hypothetical protein
MSITKIGTKKRLRFRCYDETVTPHVAADPTALTVIIDLPVGATVNTVWPADGVIVRESVGVFHLDYTTTESGLMQVRGEATGALVVAEQLAFSVAPTNIA